MWGDGLVWWMTTGGGDFHAIDVNAHPYTDVGVAESDDDGEAPLGP